MNSLCGSDVACRYTWQAIGEVGIVAATIGFALIVAVMFWKTRNGR